MRASLTLLKDLLRLLLAVVVTLWLAAGLDRARLETALAALPRVDARAEAIALMAEARHAEALMVLELAEDDDETAALRARIQADRDRWQRWARNAARGAWTGQGEDAAALGGAIAADLLVFGDVRDLVIQGGRALRGEPTDAVIIGLSTAGLLLTASPGTDLGVAVMKFARRAGALGSRLVADLKRLSGQAIARGDTVPLRQAAEAVGQISQRHAPAVSVRLLRSVERAEELPTLGRLAARPGGAYAVAVGGRPALRLALDHGDEGLALALRAARHGEAGLAFATRHARRLLRPHPLLGAAKVIYKGHPPRLLAALSPGLSLLLLAAALAWTLVSALRLVMGGVSRSGQSVPTASTSRRLPPRPDRWADTPQNGVKPARRAPIVGS